MNQRLERAYLAARLSLSLPAMSSRNMSALMTDAGVFAGTNDYERKPGDWAFIQGPFEAIEHYIKVLTVLIRIASILGLLWRSFSSTQTGYLGAPLIGVCLSPILLRLFGGLILGFRRTTARGSNKSFILRSKERQLKELSNDSAFQQENILFGLRDWILDRLDALRLEGRRDMKEWLNQQRSAHLYLDLAQNGVQTVFYVSQPPLLTDSRSCLRDKCSEIPCH